MRDRIEQSALKSKIWREKQQKIFHSVLKSGTVSWPGCRLDLVHVLNFLLKSVFCTSKCAPHSTLQNVFVFHTLECIPHFRMCVPHFRMHSAVQNVFCIPHSARVGTVIYSQCSPTIEDNHQTALWLGKRSNKDLRNSKLHWERHQGEDAQCQHHRHGGVFLCAGNGERCVCVCVCVYKNIYVAHSTESVSSFFSTNLNQNLCETVKFRK